MASWGLPGNWWLAVASTIGGVAKRLNKETKDEEMNELVKENWKKNSNNNKKETSLQLIHHGVNTKHYNHAGTVT